MEIIGSVALGAYQICIKKNAFSVMAEGVELFCFPVQCEVDTAVQEDRDIYLSEPQIVNQAGGLQAVWLAGSECWPCKQYILDVNDRGFSFRIRLQGIGSPRLIRYFMGPRDVPRPGSRYEVAGYALPAAAYADGDRMTRFIQHSGKISMRYMTPPSLVFPFWTEGVEPWVGIGVTAEPGQHNFPEFCYEHHDMRCHFQINLDGRTKIDGEWTSPAIWGGFGRDAADVVKQYSRNCYDSGLYRTGPTEKFRWWKGPFYCGWGDQVERGKSWGVPIRDLATQDFYQKLSDRLDELDLHPTAMIIDDKWQGHYGQLLPDPNKWPDLRGFVDQQHQKGRKVILWVKVWNCEGLDDDECIQLQNQPYSADPTNPKYRKRVFDTVRKLLSEDADCFNCDGFKLDFVDNILFHRDMQVYDDRQYGLELVKTMMQLFYDAAKAVKTDALINNSCCHPYFAEVTDQVRLHDYGDGMRAMMSVMTHRSALYAAAMPHALIDTDSSNRSNYREAKLYCLRAQELGVPDIYMVYDSREFSFTEQDWQEIRQVWEDYSARMDAEELKNGGNI